MLHLVCDQIVHYIIRTSLNAEIAVSFGHCIWLDGRGDMVELHFLDRPLHELLGTQSLGRSNFNKNFFKFRTNYSLISYYLNGRKFMLIYLPYINFSVMFSAIRMRFTSIRRKCCCALRVDKLIYCDFTFWLSQCTRIYFGRTDRQTDGRATYYL